MRKGQTKGEKGLTAHVQTRIIKKKHEELSAIARKTKGETISSLVRKIIEEKPITVYTRDESFDLVMEELAANRSEIRAIGVNINQMAKLFNTYPELKTKVFAARKGYERFLLLEDKIDRLLERTEEMAKRWLSG